MPKKDPPDGPKLVSSQARPKKTVRKSGAPKKVADVVELKLVPSKPAKDKPAAKADEKKPKTLAGGHIFHDGQNMLEKTQDVAKRIGRPAYVPTDMDRELVTYLAFAGFPQNRIATRLGVNTDTLAKYFQHELDTGADNMLTNITLSMAQEALNGNVTAQIFIAKTRLGWREQPGQLELTGKDGKPLEGDAKTLLIDKVMGLIEQAKIKDVAALPAPAPPIDKTKH